MKQTFRQKGFTLIEILVVIGMIAILATIVIIAINPARQFAQSRNTQRTANVESILNAIGQNIADNKGLFNCPAAIPVVAAPPATLNGVVTGSAKIASAGGIDIRGCLAPTYISELPVEPTGGVAWNGTTYDTGYYAYQDPNGRVTIYSPMLEPSLNQAVDVSITR